MKKQEYIRAGETIPIPWVLPLVTRKGSGLRTKRLFNSKYVRINNMRLVTFLRKGTTCVKCGMEATHFAVERSRGSGYHLNLYGIDMGRGSQRGKEVLFTKDHIHPKSHGGTNGLKNMQTMCSPCNKQKGNKIIGGGVSVHIQ